MYYTMRGTLDILPMGIYVNDNSMVNILSLKKVSDYFRVTMDTKDDHTVLVHYRKAKACHFKEFGKGLKYFGVSYSQMIPLMTESGNAYYYFLSNVKSNKEYFNHVEIEVADRARDL